MIMKRVDTGIGTAEQFVQAYDRISCATDFDVKASTLFQETGLYRWFIYYDDRSGKVNPQNGMVIKPTNIPREQPTTVQVSPTIAPPGPANMPPVQQQQKTLVM